ncbi:MAG TPA: succinate dehydrogenase cytochrome b subunit [Polyangiaceae bacterium]|nr:succinate dehydrogenase cytochrome b subunit [Polyangiaceae bacterium]
MAHASPSPLAPAPFPPSPPAPPAFAAPPAPARPAALASEVPPAGLRRLWGSHVGKKALMASTGFFLAGWSLAHLAGNLLIFRGPGALEQYAAFLRKSGPLLWTVRGLLAFSIAVHVVAALRLSLAARRARPSRYVVRSHEAASFASRLMGAGGVFLLAFLGYHLAHVYAGFGHASFVDGDVTGNMARGLREALAAIAYLGSALALGLHLSHGGWSGPKSLGLAGSSTRPFRRRGAIALGLAVGLGFAAVPLAIVAGWVR